jgi:hypothetical protein
VKQNANWKTGRCKHGGSLDARSLSVFPGKVDALFYSPVMLESVGHSLNCIIAESKGGRSLKIF